MEQQTRDITMPEPSRPVHTALVNVDRVPYNGKDMLKDTISEVDPEAYELMQKERARQHDGLELIASENFTSRAVREALASCMINKYSEGYPNARYYGGNEFIDKMEILCQKRALDVFGLDPAKWGVNVQPYSGSPANFEVYAATVGAHGRIMGLDLPDGGHLTHGFQTAKKKISLTSLFFESMPYRVDPETGMIDYDMLRKTALLFNPGLIIAGISCYSRHLDYARFRSIADECGALLLADMAHISGLVAAGVIPSPFEYADIVSTTTHKSLRGPRGAMIFYRKGVRSKTAKGDEIKYDLQIDPTVFPGLQGGPHNHTIAGIAVALAQCKTHEFVNYQKQVLANAVSITKRLAKHGYKIVTGGTENHLCLVDLRPLGTDGARAELVLDHCGVTCNKNTCPGDKSALKPGGIRLGTPALTSRGMNTTDFEQVADFIHEGIQLCLKYQKDPRSGKLQREYKAFVESSEDFKRETAEVMNRVKQFTSKFMLPGHDDY